MLKGAIAQKNILSGNAGSVCFLLACLFSTSHACASLKLSETRAVISANDESAIIKVENPTNYDYLIQSWVTDYNNRSQEKVFVNPPIMKIKAHHKVALHIEAVDASLKQEKQERIFLLNIKEIPKTDSRQAGSQVILTMLTKIKVFYRPAKIEPEIANQYQQLTWHNSGNKLVVSNPTPYYFTFNKVWEGNNSNSPLKADMVAPYSSLDIGKYRGSNQIHYNIINDYGDISKTIDYSL